MGVAKQIDPVVVRFPKGQPIGGDVGKAVITPENYLEGLKKINDDIRNKKNQESGKETPEQARAVVLMADYWKPGYFHDQQYQGFVEKLHELLVELVSNGAVLVTGSGNEEATPKKGPRGEVNGWPANFGRNVGQHHIGSLLVAGALSLNGALAQFAVDLNENVPNVFAPGEGITVAQGDTRVERQYRTLSQGTSDGKLPNITGLWAKSLQALQADSSMGVAAALTAGLAAYLIKLNQLGKLKEHDGSSVTGTPGSIKNWIVNNACSRQDFKENPRNSIFNGADLSENICKWDPSKNPVRRSDNSGQCIKFSSTNSSKTTSSAKTTNETKKSASETTTSRFTGPSQATATARTTTSKK